MALQQIVEQTVTGLGYDLVEIERSASGLLRITIDLPWKAPAPKNEAQNQGAASAINENDPEKQIEQIESLNQSEQFITVEDCEKVTRQLQFALEVEAVDYHRLEVSSPGIDRPLRHQQDFERFLGSVIDITLKAPIGAAGGDSINHNRKKFRGTLERIAEQTEQKSTESQKSKMIATSPDVSTASSDLAVNTQNDVSSDVSMEWQIVWRDEPATKPGQKVSKKRVPAPLQVLGFRLDELRDARLAPIVNFKGRAR